MKREVKGADAETLRARRAADAVPVLTRYEHPPRLGTKVPSFSFVRLKPRAGRTAGARAAHRVLDAGV